MGHASPRVGDAFAGARASRHLAKALCRQGYSITYKIVGRLLREMGFSLQANAKTREGGKHPDRNARRRVSYKHRGNHAGRIPRRCPMVDESNDRETRAKRYFEQDLKGQREWYGKQASSYKNRTQLLALAVICGGTSTSFLQVFASQS
jgi:hypothetical protein